MAKVTPELILERLNNHIEEDDGRNIDHDKRWDRMFGFVKEMDGKLDAVVLWTGSNQGVPEKVSKLWDFHQQNKGFLSATRLLTGGAGGFIGGIAVLLVDYFHK
jgi:hypothetical protein